LGFQNFFAQKFDPKQVLQDQRKNEVKAEILERIGTSPNEWMKNYQLIAESFDVMDWWERVGNENHRLIYPVACCILSLPDSNGHQERTFSAATWMDGKLQKRQSDMTFQMKELLYKNAEFLAKHRMHVQEDRLASAEQKTKELLQLSAAMRNALDVEDFDAEDIEEAYDSSPSEN
jgi:hAT family C-terminal dimerisation region